MTLCNTLVSVKEWVPFWELTIKNTENSFRLAHLHYWSYTDNMFQHKLKCTSRNSSPECHLLQATRPVAVLSHIRVILSVKFRGCFGVLFQTSEHVRRLQRTVTSAPAHNDWLLMKTIRKKGWCRTMSSPSQRKFTRLTAIVPNASCGKTLRYTSHWMW